MGCGGSRPGLPLRRPKRRRRFQDAYQVGELLGKGAFAQIRKAVHSKPQVEGQEQHEFAVKIAVATDAQTRKGLANEVRIWSSLRDCENIVKFYEYFTEDLGGTTIYYMVMDRCASSLLERIEEVATLRESGLVRVFREMLEGIAALHRLGIVHRDVKANNYLLGGRDQMTVQLADFGLASFMLERSLLNDVVGTTPYMSPEMLAGMGYAQETDIWSCGVTIYVIIFGCYPYMPPEMTDDATQRAILTGVPEPPFVAALGWPAPVLAVVDFARLLLQRSPWLRCSAQQALDHRLLTQPNNLFRRPSLKDATLLGPYARMVRATTREFEAPIDPTVQHAIETLVQRLQQSGADCFSEASTLIPKLKPREVEDRIVSGGTKTPVLKRSFSHSGVLMTDSLQHALPRSISFPANRSRSYPCTSRTTSSKSTKNSAVLLDRSATMGSRASLCSCNTQLTIPEEVGGGWYVRFPLQNVPRPFLLGRRMWSDCDTPDGNGDLHVEDLPAGRKKRYRILTESVHGEPAWPGSFMTALQEGEAANWSIQV